MLKGDQGGKYQFLAADGGETDKPNKSKTGMNTEKGAILGSEDLFSQPRKFIEVLGLGRNMIMHFWKILMFCLNGLNKHHMLR